MTSDITNPDRGHAQLAELQGLIDAWGAAPARWPAPARARINALIASTPGAATVLEEAHALDRLLSEGRDTAAQLTASATGALASRIFAAAMADPAALPARPAGSVVPFPVASTRNPPVAASRRATAFSRHQQWRAASVLAASLVAGIILGGSLNLAPVVQELAEVAGLSTIVDPTVGDDLSEDETL